MMQKFFVAQVTGQSAVLTGEDARHAAKSLRMKVGEELILTDSEGVDYFCRIAEVHPSQVQLAVLYARKAAGEPDLKVTLYQALPKGTKMDAIIQKCTELGATAFVPVITARTIARPDGDALSQKRERWQRIAREAAQQSARGAVPAVSQVIPFAQAIQAMRHDAAILFYESGGDALRVVLEKIAPARDVAVFIGPEGGFAPDEVTLAARFGAKTASLGARILRTETAPLAALACMMYASGNLE